MGVRLLAQRYPDFWPSICAVEESMRSDQWDLLFEEEVAKDAAFQVSRRPWGSIIRRSAFGGFVGPRAVWWHDNLTRALDEKLWSSWPPTSSPAAPLLWAHLPHRLPSLQDAAMPDSLRGPLVPLAVADAEVHEPKRKRKTRREKKLEQGAM